MTLTRIKELWNKIPGVVLAFAVVPVFIGLGFLLSIFETPLTPEEKIQNTQYNAARELRATELKAHNKARDAAEKEKNRVDCLVYKQKNLRCDIYRGIKSAKQATKDTISYFEMDEN